MRRSEGKIGCGLGSGLQNNILREKIEEQIARTGERASPTDLADFK